MAAAPQLQIVRRRLAANGKRDDMVKFQKPSFTTPAIRANECASAVVAFPHDTPNGRRDVRLPVVEHGAGRGRSTCATFRRSRSWSNTVSARSKIAAGSPVGTTWRSRSWI
jgi:hypothetical protein